MDVQQMLFMVLPEMPAILLLTAVLILLSGFMLQKLNQSLRLWGSLVMATLIMGLFAVPPTLMGRIATSSSAAWSPWMVTSALQLTVLDPLSLFWGVMSLLLLLMLLSWPQVPGTVVETARREALGGCALVAATQVMVLSANAWVQWGAMSCAGWMLCLILGRDTADAIRGRVAAACLVWFTLADLLWLLGLTSLSLVFTVSDIPAVNNSGLLTQLSGGEIALCVSSLTLLLGSLVLRCGLYPLMSWTAPAARTDRDTAWIIALGFGPAILLLLRWQTVFSAFGEIRLLMMGVGTLSAVLLGMMAWNGTRGPARVLHAAAAQLALVWLGLGANPAYFSTFQIMACALVWLLAAIALGMSQLRGSQNSSSSAASALFLCIVALCLGVAGQEQVFASIYHSDELIGLNKWMLLGGAMLGQALIAGVLFRETSVDAAVLGTDPSEWMKSRRAVPPEGVSFFGGLVFVSLSVLVLTGLLAGPFWLNLGAPPEIRRPDLCGVLMLMGLIAAWTWPIPAPASGTVDHWDGVRRLARAEFYVPGLITFGLLLPIRAASQISRFLEWFVIGNLTLKVPAFLLHALADRAALADEETVDPARMWQLATATAVMLAGVAAGLLM